MIASSPIHIGWVHSYLRTLTLQLTPFMFMDVVNHFSKANNMFGSDHFLNADYNTLNNLYCGRPIC